MVRDFGAQSEPRWRAGQRVGFLRLWAGRGFLLVSLLLIGLLPVAMPAELEEASAEGSSPANPMGRPCHPITEALFNRGWTEDPHVFTFSGVTFARRRGDADCSSEKHGLFGVVGAIWPTCRFDAAYQLAVTRGGVTRYFAVPGGYEAVIEARPEGPRCKVTKRYNIYAFD